MARLRAVVVAQDTDGDVYALAVCKFYAAGTASASGSSTSGTPYASSLYAAIAGGSPISTTQALNSSGTLTVWTEAKARFDVGIEPANSGTAFVRAYESFEFDPADVATLTGTETLTNKTLTAPSITTPTMTTPTVSSGQTTFPNGSAVTPAFTIGDAAVFYRSAAGRMGLAAGGAVAGEWDANATPAGPRFYISEAALTKTALLLGRGDAAGITPDGSYSSLMLAQSYQNEGGEAIKGVAVATAPQSSGGFITGLMGVGKSEGTWTPPGGGAVYGTIGVLAYGQGSENSSRSWAGNLKAQQLAGNGSALVGLEIDVESYTGATIQDRYGLIVVTSSDGANYGTGEDVALKFANKNATANNRWRDAVIAFSSENDNATSDGWPAQSTATLIKAYDPNAVGVTATDGIDLSVVVFSGHPLKLPNFVVNQPGRIAVRTTAVDGTTPIRVNADSDTNLMVIDNASTVTQATVGGAGAASALPGNPAGYLILKIGATQQVIPYWAKS